MTQIILRSTLHRAGGCGRRQRCCHTAGLRLGGCGRTRRCCHRAGRRGCGRSGGGLLRRGCGRTGGWTVGCGGGWRPGAVEPPVQKDCSRKENQLVRNVGFRHPWKRLQ